MRNVTLTADQFWSLRNKLERKGRKLTTDMGVTGDTFTDANGYTYERVAISNIHGSSQLSVWAEVDAEAGVLSFVDAPKGAV